MKNLFFILGILVPFLNHPLYGQNQVDTFHAGNSRIIKSAYLDSLIAHSAVFQKNKAVIDGYRIQIYSGLNRIDANQVKSKFLKYFPDIKTYLIYQSPYYKVRVGDFHNRVEALPLLTALKELNEFRYVLLIPDKIFFPELKNSLNE